MNTLLCVYHSSKVVELVVYDFLCFFHKKKEKEKTNQDNQYYKTNVTINSINANAAITPPRTVLIRQVSTNYSHILIICNVIHKYKNQDSVILRSQNCFVNLFSHNDAPEQHFVSSKTP